MNAHEVTVIRVHEDTALFREAIRFTSAETGFIPRLIEKDYFCTVVLQYLFRRDAALIFKGGTCLAKVHAGFYRLSEDLDFAISMPIESTRAARSRSADAFKAAVRRIPDELPAFTIVEAVAGANSSKQYTATIGYTSALGSNPEIIKIEVGLREPMLSPVQMAQAQTLLLDPVRGGPMVDAVSLPCISPTEAMAEKLRAALTRREVAIRDFYDVDHAVRNLGLDVAQAEFVALIARKLVVPDNEPIDVSDARLLALRQQVDAQLRPVLRSREYEQFDLDRAVGIIRGIAQSVESSLPALPGQGAAPA